MCKPGTTRNNAGNDNDDSDAQEMANLLPANNQATGGAVRRTIRSNQSDRQRHTSPVIRSGGQALTNWLNPFSGSHSSSVNGNRTRRYAGSVQNDENRDAQVPLITSQEDVTSSKRRRLNNGSIRDTEEAITEQMIAKIEEQPPPYEQTNTQSDRFRVRFAKTNSSRTTQDTELGQSDIAEGDNSKELDGVASNREAMRRAAMLRIIGANLAGLYIDDRDDTEATDIWEDWGERLNFSWNEIQNEKQRYIEKFEAHDAREDHERVPRFRPIDAHRDINRGLSRKTIRNHRPTSILTNRLSDIPEISKLGNSGATSSQIRVYRPVSYTHLRAHET